MFSKMLALDALKCVNQLIVLCFQSQNALFWLLCIAVYMHMCIKCMSSGAGFSIFDYTFECSAYLHACVPMSPLKQYICIKIHLKKKLNCIFFINYGV